MDQPFSLPFILLRWTHFPIEMFYLLEADGGGSSSPSPWSTSTARTAENSMVESSHQPRGCGTPRDVGPPGIWDTPVPRDELCRLPPSWGVAKPCRSPIPQFQSQSNTTSSALAQHTGRAASLPCRDGFPRPGSVTHPVEQRYPARIKHGVWECCALCWRASGRSRNEQDTEHGAMWGPAWGKDQHLLAGILGSFHSHMAS